MASKALRAQLILFLFYRNQQTEIHQSHIAMIATVSRAPGISLSPSSNLLHDATYSIIFAFTSSFAKCK